MRLIEPLGLLEGSAGRLAVAAGLARKLGEDRAYTLARLIEPDMPDRLVGAGAITEDWLPAAAALAGVPPFWAGLALNRPRIMGILNLTDDSFSDGGRYPDADAAIQAGRSMAAAGADVIDVGAESTRPGALAVPSGAECERLLPVVAALAAAGLMVSVDTRNAATMARCLDAGAAIVNDVSALTHDVLAAPLVAARGCPVVLMHMRGTPATMDRHAAYDDVAVEVCRELAALRDRAEQAGIRRTAIMLDPGIGFAKLGRHNHVLLDRLALFGSLGCALLVGASRKRFLGGADPSARLPGSLAAAVLAARHGANMLRVHDVAETVQALRVGWPV